jgi:hypothetical protein
MLPPTIAGPSPALPPRAPRQPLSSRWRLPSHHSTATVPSRPLQSPVPHGHSDRPAQGKRTSQTSLLPNPHRAGPASQPAPTPRFRALALLGRLPSACHQHLRRRSGVPETCTPPASWGSMAEGQQCGLLRMGAAGSAITPRSHERKPWLTALAIGAAGPAWREDWASGLDGRRRGPSNHRTSPRFSA